MFLRKKRFHRLFLCVLGALVITQIVVFSPSSLDENKSEIGPIDPLLLTQNVSPNNEKTLAPGIPKNRIPEYRVDQFRYVSVQNGLKQWRIKAETAFLYNPEKLNHSRIVTAYLYDSGDGDQVTIVKGLEAKYLLNEKDLEVFGNVETLFPDGFEVHSDYMRYHPSEHHIEIPTHYPVTGVSHEATGQKFSFASSGLDYILGESMITLPQAVTVILQGSAAQPPVNSGVPEMTKIESDHCLIFRKLKLAQFTMNPHRPLQTRFVHITQPTLFARSRRADLNYGDFSQVLQYLTAYDDVLIKEVTDKLSRNPIKDKKPVLRYATGGRADFDTQRDLITLTQFPQSYQNEDTVTGDQIIMHRDTDLIEVEHSNAFSQGLD